MRIGILTFHTSFNYGAFMQCFSLCKRLQRDFPEAQFEIADYTSARVRERYDNYDKQIEACQNEQIRDQMRICSKGFEACRAALPLSDEELVSDDISKAAAFLNDRYDAVIVGSDAVWNWNVRGFPNIYFLRDFRGAKFSYAASAHGLNYQEATPEQKQYLKEAFSEFRYIGVRDCTTENMVHMVLPERKVFHNCDPTVLLKLDEVPCDLDALREKMAARGVDFSKPLIGLMAGDTIGAAVKRHFGDRVQLVAVYNPNSFADVSLLDLSPYEWAHVFSFFRLTLTHFFHGTLLSLRNGIPVLPIETANAFSAKNTTKIEDVMQRLGLSRWRCTIDHSRYSKVRRGIDKVFHCCDRKLWKQVNGDIETLLHENHRQEILSKLDAEADNYSSFAKAMADYLKEKETP